MASKMASRWLNEIQKMTGARTQKMDQASKKKRNV
jgi:hypothetical protein